MSQSAIVVIDYTNDFVADKGALTTGAPGQAIDSPIVSELDRAQADDDWIILATDLHDGVDPYHPETALYPPHNLANTWGRDLYGEVGKWYQDHQQDAMLYSYPKNRYSAFANTNLDNFLRERRITALTLVGVCTDICVLHTAVDAYNRDYDLVIPENAVASFNQAGHDWALGHFKNVLGATVR